VQTTPPDIRDSKLLRLLGEILRSDVDGSNTSGLRLQLMGSGFSWQALVDLALGQGVLLPLIFALTARMLSPPIPRSIKNDSHVSVRLERVYTIHLEYRKREKEQLEELLLVLERARVAPLILKGARYLVDPVGAWGEARAMGDFDLLVRRSDSERAHAALTAAGYRQMPGNAAPFESAHHLPPLEHPDHPMALEIHLDPLTPTAGKIMGTREVWAHASKAEAGAFFVLPPAWHAVHGLLHHQVQDRGHAQYKLCIKGLWEWSVLAHAFTDDDWRLVRTHMRAARALDILDSWSIQSHRLFGLEPPWLTEISATARRHADATLRRAFRPYWMRRAGQIADELKVSFARETLAAKYDVAPGHVSLEHAARNLMELVQRHHGNVLQRLTGYGRQP
jgi:hypothetical protein